MNDENLAYCWTALNNVSRSFALSIEKLPKVTKNDVMISYLICRIADTIEDSKLEIKSKKKSLKEFRKILQKERYDYFKDFIECARKGTRNNYEEDLIINTERIMDVFYAVPSEIKVSIKRWIFNMTRGMEKYLGKDIKTMAEQDDYCFFVAGTVGNMLTEIYLHRQHISKEDYKKMIGLARHFGLGLQKVNIIKNIKTDFDEERMYWPSTFFADFNINYEDLFKQENKDLSLKIARELIINARHHLSKGLDYILLIPEKESEIRESCLIPLLMAVATLNMCCNNSKIFFSEDDGKISRTQLEEILMMAHICRSSNSKIKEYYDNLSFLVS